MNFIKRGLVLLLIIMAGLLVMVTGCSQTKAPATLALWHYESANGAMGIAWDAAIAEFKKSHPNVTVNFEQKGFEQIRQTAAMVLNSDQAADVMEYNKGNATAGLLSSQGLLSNLTSVAQSRGWDKILGPSLQTTCRYSKEGIMGSGDWFGVTNYGEYVMVYYNKDMFAKQNLAVPKTLDEFEAAMQKFTAAGITPLALAGAEYPAQQVFYELVLSKADRNLINAYQLYQGKVDFHGPEFTFGAERMLQWVQKGFISKDAVSMKAEDMGLAFEGGQNPIMISGSWWYGRLMNEIKNFQWGIFLFPGNKFHPGSGGNIWVVPTKAVNKELAYDFIDITLKKDIQTTLGNAGGIPVNADLDKITDPKVKELIANFNEINAADGIAFYPDWPVPGFYDVLVSAVQELIGQTKTPQAMLDTLATEYAKH